MIYWRIGGSFLMRMIHMKRMILTNKMVLMKDNSYNEDD